MARTALVIGASRGIGREFVRQLCEDGWKVFATARDDASLAMLTDEGAHAIKIDVTKPESLAELPWRLDGEKIDLALYVAGVLPNWEGATESPSLTDFDATMHANVLGAMQSLPLLAPFVSDARGRFIFITSIMGSIAEASGSTAWIYRASKAALNMAVYSARRDYPDLTLAVIHPGWVQTDMGGSGATVLVRDSVSGMRKVIETLKPSDSGVFMAYDGRKIAW
ncbi:MAG: SDR family oxidoreductase [Oxalobacteraceae bacterium]|jgi:NAD(P)-dependent dehydrogenase (short-subunit alcohol dehydrogenase family)|nr:SDR family oxidoreductase [Oxalobacteraceae bacterium]